MKRKIVPALSLLAVMAACSANNGSGGSSADAAKTKQEFLGKYGQNIHQIDDHTTMLIHDDGKITYSIEQNPRCIFDFEGEIAAVELTGDDHYTVQYRYNFYTDTLGDIQCAADDAQCELDRQDCVTADDKYRSVIGRLQSFVIKRAGDSERLALNP